MASLKSVLFKKKTEQKPFSVEEFERIERTSKLKLTKLEKVKDGLLSLPVEERRKLYKCRNQYVATDKILPWNINCLKDQQKQEQSTNKDFVEFRPDEALNKKIAVWYGDIASLEVDAIANPCAYYLYSQAEQETVNSEIQNGGGKCLLHHIRHLGFCPKLGLVVTPGYRLPAKYIFHVNGPNLGDSLLAAKLENSYISCFEELKKMGLRTLAVPCISSGKKGIPSYVSAEIALMATRKWLESNRDSVDLIIFCVYTRESKEEYLKTSHKMFPVPQSGDTKLPQEILHMDDASINLYTRALSDGEEKVFDIRLKLVGHKGVGKSTLTKRLLQEKVDTTERKSTEGIDVHIRRCRIHLDTGQWSCHDESEAINNRLFRALTCECNTGEGNVDTTSVQAVQESNEVDKALSGEGNAETTSVLAVQETTEVDVFSIENEESTMPKVRNTDYTDSRSSTKVDAVCMNPCDEVVYDRKGEPAQLKEDSKPLKDLIKELQERGTYGEDNKDIANVSIWDFAGQTVFYNTHQIFLASRTIYLLVSDISEPLDKTVDSDPNDCLSLKTCKVSEIMEFWLNSIHFFCHDIHNMKGPPVILVATHADLIKIQDGTNDTEITDNYFLQIRKLFLEKETVQHIVNDADIAIDNTREDQNIEKLRNTILEVAKKQKYWGERRPAKWIVLEKRLFDLKMNGEKIIDMTQLSRLNSELPIPLSEEEELMLFLRFQNDLGNFLHFNDDNLRDYVILNPQWLVDAFKCLVTTSKSFAGKKSDRLSMLMDFERKGKLADALLRDVLCHDSRFEKHCDVIINFLQRFYIIAEPRGNVCDSDNTAEYFFAPCMLQNPPENMFATEDNNWKTNRLCFTTSKEFLPEILFNCFLAACISRFNIFRENGQDQIFLGCGVFKFNSEHTFTVYYVNNFIKIWVRWYNPKKSGPGRGVCENVHQFVSDTLKQLIRSETDLNVYIDCPEVELRSLKGLCRLDNLLEEDGVMCGDHGLAHYLSSSDVLKHWRDPEDNGESESPSVLKHDQQSQRPTDKQLIRISSRIGKEYKVVGHYLGITQAEIDQIVEDNLCAVDRTYHVLAKWKNKRGVLATFKELEDAFKESGIDVLDMFNGIFDSDMGT